MPRAGRKTYYWDTASFIAWLDGGKGHASEVVTGFDEVAAEIAQNRANLCTSVLTYTEVLEGKLTRDQAARFENLFKRRNVTSITVDNRIAKRASEIRNYYNEKGIKLSTPDSIHLATAIIYEVDEFHTLDGDGHRKRPNDLLRLNGDVAGYPLHIRVPKAVQGSLLANVGPLTIDNTTKVGEEIKQAGNGELQSARTEENKVTPEIASEPSSSSTEPRKEKGPPSL
jgi:predicted nucleic acid-binding protein